MFSVASNLAYILTSIIITYVLVFSVIKIIKSLSIFGIPFTERIPTYFYTLDGLLLSVATTFSSSSKLSRVFL